MADPEFSTYDNLPPTQSLVLEVLAARARLGENHWTFSTRHRRDGALKTRAVVGHPGVAVSFESKYGPLRYATDRYEARWSGDMPGWQANVRAVALGLAALRAVDRYGVTRRGEQYRGWSALPAARAGTSEWFTTRKEAADWMTKGAAELGLASQAGPAVVDAALYRALAMRMHPDKTRGDRELWDRLNAAAELLGLRENKHA